MSKICTKFVRGSDLGWIAWVSNFQAYCSYSFWQKKNKKSNTRDFPISRLADCEWLATVLASSNPHCHAWQFRYYPITISNGNAVGFHWDIIVQFDFGWWIWCQLEPKQNVISRVALNCGLWEYKIKSCQRHTHIRNIYTVAHLVTYAYRQLYGACAAAAIRKCNSSQLHSA